MTEPELAAIRARAEATTCVWCGNFDPRCPECGRLRMSGQPQGYPTPAREDVRALLAEVERLRAEAAGFWSVGHKRDSRDPPLVTCSECGAVNPYVTRQR